MKRITTKFVLREEKTRTITLELKVIIPAAVGESEVENAINAALNEPPCDWGNWEVGAATIKLVTKP